MRSDTIANQITYRVSLNTRHTFLHEPHIRKNGVQLKIEMWLTVGYFVKLTVRHAYAYAVYMKSHMRVSLDLVDGNFEMQWLTVRIGVQPLIWKIRYWFVMREGISIWLMNQLFRKYYLFQFFSILALSSGWMCVCVCVWGGGGWTPKRWSKEFKNQFIHRPCWDTLIEYADQPYQNATSEHHISTTLAPGPGVVGGLWKCCDFWSTFLKF